DPANNASVPSDIDGDGFSNDDETAAGSDPANRASVPSDIDGDGFSNDDETAAGSDPANRSSIPSDIDADGFSNDDETAAGSDPANSASVPSDIDGDGFSNDDETAAGSDPANNASVPSDIDGDGIANVDDVFPTDPTRSNLDAPEMTLTFHATKLFRFDWTDVEAATYYRLLENPDGLSGFTQVGQNIAAGVESMTLEVPLYARPNGEYILQACNDISCTDSATLFVESTMVEAIGYVKASNPDANDNFGTVVSLSSDGSTLVVGTPTESSDAVGVDGDQNNNAAGRSGAVYVFNKTAAGQWSQQAYLKASNTGSNDRFGFALHLSRDGNTLAVGAPFESSDSTGVNGDQSNNNKQNSGAVYIFVRDISGNWSQQAYIKATHPTKNAQFARTLTLSADGNTLAAGAMLESSNATGIDGDETNTSASTSGAVYIFTRNTDTWNQQAYVKASNTGENDLFGSSVSLNQDGSTLVVGATREDSSASGINGDQSDNSAQDSGAVYVFVRDDTDRWSQQAYIKASTSETGDYFGSAVTLNDDGSILAVGAQNEDSSSGINGDETDNSAANSGATYIFIRDSTDQWSQEAYLKAQNARFKSNFGSSLSMNSEGNVLAIGAVLNKAGAPGVNGDVSANGYNDSGAVYTFIRDIGGQWNQQAVMRASNIENAQKFGSSISLNSDATVLAIGSRGENGGAKGINSDQSDDSLSKSGAVYLF
ncbi:FG-GAP repeat protein, partial [Gynuella sp.]|uniref:FG-GAP repeat protein n=1 Tax=Gynuella sp. TaxID=2969146 RepID=UPI003D13485B